jgi:hypothetical protein
MLVIYYRKGNQDTQIKKTLTAVRPTAEVRERRLVGTILDK